MPVPTDFDKDYFENGLVLGKSGYVNYQWLPELTIKLAYNIIKHLDIKDDHSILDYGCAKGYLVKAMRILDVEAYGVDISQYAIESADSAVREHCKLISQANMFPFETKFNWLISKDVLEHMTEEYLSEFLKASRKVAERSFHVIPLGKGDGRYVIPAYDLDVTHNIAQSKDWWIDQFCQAGWKLKSCSYKVPGIKDNWTSKYEQGNIFLIFE